MYQESANATLAKTQLGIVTQPYVPFNDNALAVKELQAMTDRLALETRVLHHRACQPRRCKAWWIMPKCNGA